MKYIINHSNDTAFNIALEEYAFKHLWMRIKSSYFGLTSHLSLLVVIKITIEEINRDYVRENGIEVVRRISGGGAVTTI